MLNKNQKIHNERKEYWRKQIALCEASGMLQQDWCRENHICNASLSRWRTTIWREEEAEEELRAAREENSFVEITAEVVEASTSVTKISPKANGNRKLKQTGDARYISEVPHMVTPDAVIGYRDYMVEVYEHTSSQVLEKVMEVLRNA